MKLKKDGNDPIRTRVKSTRRRGEPVPKLSPEVSENLWFNGRRKQHHEHGRNTSGLTKLEFCAGASRQVLSYEQAGIRHAAQVVLEKRACGTLSLNRSGRNVIEQDVNKFSGSVLKDVDIMSGGLPCLFQLPESNLARKMIANCFRAMIRFVDEIRPRS